MFCWVVAFVIFNRIYFIYLFKLNYLGNKEIACTGKRCDPNLFIK